MKRALVSVALLFAVGCKDGPEEVDPMLLDTGIDLEKDSGTDPFDAGDSGTTDTGTTSDGGPGDAMDAQPDGDVVDGDLPDGDQPDGDQPDGDGLDGDQPDGDQDAEVDPDGGDAGVDTGPVQLTEDFTDPVNEIFTCPDTTQVLPGLAVENGTQCLGIDGSGCPDVRGLPGPGSAECADPAQNPFIGTGQCVADFFACFDPMGTCANNNGTFTWGNGAVQNIMVDGTGRLIRSEFIPSTSTVPCIVGLPEVAGGTRVIYTQQ